MHDISFLSVTSNPFSSLLKYYSAKPVKIFMTHILSFAGWLCRGIDRDDPVFMGVSK